MAEQQEEEYPIIRLLRDIAIAASPKHPDRGMLAALRRGFNDDTQMLAWPYLARYCELTDVRELTVIRFIAATAAMLEEDGLAHGGVGNLGATMRKLVLGEAGAEKSPAETLASFDGRFRRLLSCRTAEELCQRLVEVVQAASAKGCVVDLEKLYWDIKNWEARDIRMEWARGYWEPGKGA